MIHISAKKRTTIYRSICNVGVTVPFGASNLILKRLKDDPFFGGPW